MYWYPHIVFILALIGYNLSLYFLFTFWMNLEEQNPHQTKNLSWSYQCMIYICILCAEVLPLDVQALASKAGVKRPGEEAPQGQPGQSPVLSGLFYPSRSVPFSVLRNFDLVAFPVSKVFRRFADTDLVTCKDRAEQSPLTSKFLYLSISTVMLKT